jgi:threonylcarbamoyladenosine tRNA methylthiotransferase MtaB
VVRRVAFATLGCKVNQSETEAMKELFRERGYQVVRFNQPADVYVINTCTVTSVADRKSRQLVRRASRLAPDATVAVIGCWPQVATDKVKELPEVDVIIGTGERSLVVDLVEEAARTKKRVQHVTPVLRKAQFEELPLDYSTHTRAFLKIEDGCNQFCTYCIIPYARGTVRSRSPEKVVAAAEQLAAKGYKEIVLTGIHLGLYGSDFSPKSDLTVVLKLLEDVPGLERIRISSLDPAEVTPELLELVAGSSKICPHLHIPLQSGSTKILQRMRRPYTAEEYLKLVKRIRQAIPDIGLTTDVIVGFPGETEEDFADTIEVVKIAGFSRLHVFPYSPRTGTLAAEFPDQVETKVKEERSHRLISLGHDLALAFHRRYLGQQLNVLVETERHKGQLVGYSGNYIRVHFSGDDCLMNQIVPVTALKAAEDHVYGQLQQEFPAERRNSS